MQKKIHETVEHKFKSSQIRLEVAQHVNCLENLMVIWFTCN